MTSEIQIKERTEIEDLIVSRAAEIECKKNFEAGLKINEKDFLDQIANRAVEAFLNGFSRLDVYSKSERFKTETLLNILLYLFVPFSIYTIILVTPFVLFNNTSPKSIIVIASILTLIGLKFRIGFNLFKFFIVLASKLNKSKCLFTSLDKEDFIFSHDGIKKLSFRIAEILEKRTGEKINVDCQRLYSDYFNQNVLSIEKISNH